MPINGSMRRIIFIEMQRQGIILALMCLCPGKMWKSHVKNVFRIPRWPVGVKSNYVILRGVSWLRNHLPHMPAHSRQSEPQNIIDTMHTWQQCSVSISEDILTKYGFSLRWISPLTHDNNTNTQTEDWRRYGAHAQIGPRNHQVAMLLKRHTLVPSPTLLVHSVSWDWRDREHSANFSTGRFHSLAESRHVVGDVKPYV